MTRKRAAIIYNPVSGGSNGRHANRVRKMTALLAERGIDAIAMGTTGPNQAAGLASRALIDGIDLIISFGGDGTLNEVVQGMVGGNAVLAIWPGGTENVAARDLGLPASLERLADVIAAGKTKRISLGLAKPDLSGSLGGDVSQIPSPRYFFMFAGIGLDASICRGVNPALKALTGKFAFWVSGIKHVLFWNAEPFMIDVEGQRLTAAFALIGNGKRYGGGMKLTPGARLEDECLEVFVLPPRKRNIGYLVDLLKYMRGNVAGRGKIYKGKKISARSDLEPWVEVDGEVMGPVPMTFEVVPDALTILVP
jgi:diacylglycerol kinase (ATP)